MKEVNKNRYNTFLVFHSGNVIMSSMHIDYMKDTYNKFINIIKECRPQIEENIEV
jgi:TATA-box binding protein (TBP) (component of TFIID and TFIIIB)